MYNFGYLSSGHYIYTTKYMRIRGYFRSQKGLENTDLKNAKVKH